MNEITAKGMVNLHNRFDIVVKDAETNEIVQKAQAENILLDRIYTRLLNFQTFFVNIVFGEGTGTPTSSRTTLFSRIGYKAAETDQLIRSYPTSVWTRKIRLGTEEYNGKIITEVGISNQTTDINTHAMITDAEGNPLSVEKASTTIIDIYATVFVDIYDVDSGLFWYDNGLRDYLTGTGSAGNTLGISYLNEAVTRAGTIATDASARTTKTSTRFNLDDLNKEVKYIDWTAIGLRCVIPRPNVFGGIQKNDVLIGVGDGEKTLFTIPQTMIKNIDTFVDGVKNEDWTRDISNGGIVFNNPPASDAIITANYFCDLIPKDANHVLDVSMKIGFGVGQPSPVVPDPTPTLPGEETPVGGNTRLGFFGEVAVEDLINGEDLCTHLGLTVGTLQHSDAGWLKFANNGGFLFVAKKTIRHSISWNSINAVGAVFGEKLILIGNNVYAIRLLTSPEWDALIVPTHVDSGSKWWNYIDADLQVNYNVSGNGCYTWTSTPSGSYRIFRGYSSVSYSNSYLPSDASSNYGFRPVLEFLYTLS